MKTYKFYGWKTADVKDSKGLTPRDYYDKFLNAWCYETCAPRYRPEWSEENPTLGQCSITSFILQDFYGGKVYGIPLDEGGYHCFNVVGDCTFDITSEQFGDVALDYDNVTEQFREDHFSDASKKERYDLLKQRLMKVLQSDA